jgi:hypothetical protein
MRLRFYIDPETTEPHIYKHRVTEAEVEQVLGRAGEDRPGRDGAGSRSDVLYLVDC